MKKSPVRMAALASLLLAACDNPGEPEVDRDACDALPSATYAGDVRLGVGEAMPLAAGASLCLALPSAGDREYVLAYVDTRAIEASRTAREPLAMDSFTVTVGGAGSNLRAARSFDAASPAPRHGLHPADVLATDVAAQTSHHPAARATPWTEGETFTLLDNIRGVDRPARIHRIYDGWLVIAAFEDGVPPGMARTVATLDEAWPSIRQHGLPMLTAAFGERPFTSRGSRQLLLVFRSDVANLGGVAYGATDGTDVFSWLVVRALDPAGPGSQYTLGSVTFHEIAHAYQRAYLHATRPPGSPASVAAGGSRWGIEGGATLMQRELLRRQAGIAFASNFDGWRNPGSEAERGFSGFAQPGDGSFNVGYEVSAGFLTDLVARRVAAGEALEAAIAEVSRGAVEGWFGWVTATQPQRAGLAARMRPRLGSGWEPADALLTWALSHAMDDRTSSPVFQDRDFREVSRLDDGEFGWTSHAVLRDGDAPHAVRRQYGAPGYFTLTGGGAFHLRADVDGVRWMIARVD